MKGGVLAQTGFWRHVLSVAWKEAQEEVRSHLVVSLLTVVASFALGTGVGVAGGGVLAALMSVAGLPLLIAVLLYLWKLIPTPGRLHHDQQQEIESLRQQLQDKPLPKFEVIARRHDDLDYVSLTQAFSSSDPDKQADLTALSVGLSEIEIINHDDKPTEVQRLWVGVWDPEGKNEITPREIKEEELTGSRRIDARSRQSYRLKFTAFFDGLIPREERAHRVMLQAKAIGPGEVQTKLEEAFFL